MSDDPIKDALQMIPYGFYSITTTDGAGEVNIMVANWLMQTSFTPRMVAFGLARKAYSHSLVKKGRKFVVNIFNKVDADAIKGYTKSREKNPDKVANAKYTLSPTVECPVLEGAAAYLECEVRVMLDAGGDHDIVIAEVVHAGVMKPGEAEETLTLPDLGWSYAG
ncbi:MAG: flavin reductase family protein [Anaerolineales bacterium]|nr:flavin reductase family protein [Anaerolineales bacterium]